MLDLKPLKSTKGKSYELVLVGDKKVKHSKSRGQR